MKSLRYALVAAAIGLSAPSAQAAQTDTMLVSSGRNGEFTGYKADIGGISGTGRYVLFSSRSPKIVKGDTNGARDVFVWDRKTGSSVRVNVASDGSQTGHAGDFGHIGSEASAISDDGKVVLFSSRAPGLARSDTGDPDAFVHDLRTGKTTLVSRNSEDRYGAPIALSPNGRFVGYYLNVDGTTERETFLYDRQTKERSRIDLLYGDDNPNDLVAIANDGTTVTFVSADQSLQNQQQPMPTGSQVYVLDLTTNEVEQVSVSSDEQGANNSSGGGEMSPDGRYVVFVSDATNLAPGQDLNTGSDIFLRDRVEGTTTLVTVGEGGFPANGTSYPREVSDDGCRVVFDSEASNLVPNDSNDDLDVFVRDLCAGTMTRVSVGADGAEANGLSYQGFLSGDGRWAAFLSRAANLANDDPDPKFDVFLRGPL